MGHLELVAIEKFAEGLKVDFPILLHPKTFDDRMMNTFYEHAIKMIDLEVKRARWEFDKQADKEVVRG
jgi:hypothetical protein